MEPAPTAAPSLPVSDCEVDLKKGQTIGQFFLRFIKEYFIYNSRIRLFRIESEMN